MMNVVILFLMSTNLWMTYSFTALTPSTFGWWSCLLASISPSMHSHSYGLSWSVALSSMAESERAGSTKLLGYRAAKLKKIAYSLFPLSLQELISPLVPVSLVPAELCAGTQQECLIHMHRDMEY